jgi:hypothetical protein
MHGTLIAGTSTARHSRREGAFGRATRMVWRLDEFRQYRYRLAELPTAAPVEVGSIRRDHVPDLELYEPSAPWWIAKNAFLSTARERLAGGEHVYTYATSGRLLHYAWLADRRDDMVVYEVDQTFHFAIPGAMLYDAHTIPEARGQGFHTRSLFARLHDAQSLAGARWAYVGCLANNHASRSVIEKGGFAYYTSLYRMKTLGFTSRWQATARV